MTSLIPPVLIKGLALGFSAGIAPGPLTLLVITQTLQHGLREGFKVSVAPLITDLPIICVCIFVLSNFSNVPTVLAIISFSGAYFLSKMAIENWRAPAITVRKHQEKPASLLRGVTTNLLNPHPYIFWLTIGSPIILEDRSSQLNSAILFIGGMFTMMIGVKILIAWLAKEFRPYLAGAGYRFLLRASAATLIFFSLTFIREGLVLLGIL